MNISGASTAANDEVETGKKMKTKIKALRKSMKNYGIQAYLVPGTDPHMSEYVPEFWQRRKFISGFTGSAGTVIITQNKAGLWTDSRYFLQAEKQLDGRIFTLFKMGMPDAPAWQEWIAENLEEGDTLGLDSQLISHKEYETTKSRLARKKIGIKCIRKNLVDLVWDKRPEPRKEKIEVHKRKYSGETVSHKLKRLRSRMAEEESEAHVISRLDAIAWLFNIRGSDVPFNPVVISSAIVTQEKALLFVAREKISSSVRHHLEKTTDIYPYENLDPSFKSLPEAANGFGWIKTS